MDPIRPNHKIDSLEESLYSRVNAPLYKDERTKVGESEHLNISQNWNTSQGEDIHSLIEAERNKRETDQSKLFKKIFLFSVLFFVAAIGIAVFMFFGGRNFISGNNIDIQVVGPATTAGGEVLSLDVVIKNANKVALQNVALVTEYPSGTRSGADVNIELSRTREEIENVPPKDEVRKIISAILFGEKDEIQEIVMTLEYQLEGSSATYTKEKRYEIAIQSSPVIVTISNPIEINVNQEFEFVVDIAANSPETLRGVLFKAEYPFGFIYKDASPSPFVGTNVWSIGDLPPTEKRKITIRGVLQGQNDEERTFRFFTGIVSAQNEESLGAIFSNLMSSIRIRRPFLAVSTTIGGSQGDTHPTIPGARVTANIVWENNLPSELFDSVVEVKIVGDVLDKSTVSPSTGGFYRSVDNTIVWDKNSRKNQMSLSPGSSDSVSFTFSPQKNLQPNIGSKKIDIVISVTGNQITDTGKQEQITTVVDKSVLLASTIGLNARSVRSIGNLENFGPIPPRADTEVSYTGVWSISNTFNTVTDGVVKAILPTYVKWEGRTSPSSESISYDPLTREITWNVGNVEPATGTGSKRKEVYFSISFIPSISQVGMAPILVQPATFIGKDRYTGASVQDTSPAITTRFDTDPTYRFGDEGVAN